MNDATTTDAYKLAMAQAGYPLRRETFYLSFRRGGWQRVPHDLAAAVRSLLPREPVDAATMAWLDDASLGLTKAMRRALGSEVQIDAVPAGAWVFEREPVLTVSGPSFLLSWLEPQIIRLFFPLQLATEVVRGTVTDDMLRVTCEQQAAIAREVLLAHGGERHLSRIRVEEESYRQAVREQARALIEVVEDPARLFEVGMRAATCEEQHRLCVEQLAAAGIDATSNVGAARALGIRAVGTMGHEHVQRWGSDRDAYRAMRDMRTGAPSYLLDTFDTLRSGLPAAIDVMLEQPHACSIRYDSGDQLAQLMVAHGQLRRAGLDPVHVIEDGLTAERTARFEQLRRFIELSPTKLVYGYGGYLVDRPSPNPLSRDRIGMVYKVSETGGRPCMKLGDEAGLGKVSIPGHPVVWRRLRGRGPLGIVAQAGEEVPEDYVALGCDPEAPERMRLCGVDAAIREEPPPPHTLSPATQALVVAANAARQAAR